MDSYIIIWGGTPILERIQRGQIQVLTHDDNDLDDAYVDWLEAGFQSSIGCSPKVARGQGTPGTSFDLRMRPTVDRDHAFGVVRVLRSPWEEIKPRLRWPEVDFGGVDVASDNYAPARVEFSDKFGHRNRMDLRDFGNMRKMASCL